MTLSESWFASVRGGLVAVVLGALVLAAAAGAASADVDLALGNGDKVTGSLDPATEIETFRVQLPQGALLSVTAKGKKSKGSKVVPPVAVQVLDAADTDIAAGRLSVSAKGVKLKKLLVGASGEYRVVVTGDGVTPGDYKLVVKWSSPRKLRETIDLTDGPVMLPLSVDAGAVLSFTAKASKRSDALPRLASLDGDAFTQMFDAPAAGASSHKAKKISLSQGGDYVLSLTDAGAGGSASVKVSIKPPRPSKRKVGVSLKELGSTTGGGGETPVARGALIGSAGGSIEVPAGVSLSLAGSALTVPAGALPSAVPLLIGSAPPIEPADVKGIPDLAGVGPTVFFGPAGTSFAAPVTVTIPFEPADFDGDFSTLVVVERQANGKTRVVPASEYTIDAIAGTVSFPTAHFTSFRVLGPPPGQSLPGFEFEELPLLPDPDARASSGFGLAMDTDGAQMVIGSPFYGGDVSQGGAAYVYALESGVWVFKQRLTSGELEVGERFGTSVAIDEDWIVVGAASADVAVTNSGGVYAYEKVGTVWTLRHRFAADESLGNDFFGIAVDLDDDLLVVGASLNDAAADRSGRVYVFERSGPAQAPFVQVEKFSPPAPVQGSEFGTDVSLEFPQLVVGAPGEEAAYVFVHDGNIFEHVTRLAPDGGPNFGSLFGITVLATGGDTAIVAAPLEGGQIVEHGAVYAFVEDTPGTWVQNLRLVADEPVAQQHFGTSLAFGGLVLVVGAEGEVTEQGATGAVHVFGPDEQDGVTLIDRLVPASAGPGARAGSAVALYEEGVVFTGDALGAGSIGAIATFRVVND